MKNSNKITKKLQKMVKDRKTTVVVLKQDAYRQYSRPSRRSTSISDYSYGSMEDT